MRRSTSVIEIGYIEKKIGFTWIREIEELSKMLIRPQNRYQKRPMPQKPKPSSLRTAHLLTIYGRKPVLEALQDESLEIFRLHFSESNRPSPELKRMAELARKRGVEIVTHEKGKLSRISKNARQDQGVALDIVAKNLSSPEEFILKNEKYRLLALDRITNPRNVG